MKNIKEFILESYNSNVEKFKKYLKKYKVTMKGPDSTGIAYITPTEDDEAPSICIVVDDKSWTCYLDSDKERKIFVSLDADGEADEELNASEFETTNDGFSYSDKNAELLAKGILKFKE